ncbi:MAG: hypothetical protein AAGI23_06785 [Bacteroidota bacterium]
MLTLIALTGAYQIYRKTTGRELPLVENSIEKLKTIVEQRSFSVFKRTAV